MNEDTPRTASYYPVGDYYGYPTEDTLHQIQSATDPKEALELAYEAWAAYGSVTDRLSSTELKLVMADSDNDTFLRFATGGWSGNESIIGSLRDNAMVWALTWRLSAVGGLHIFRIPRYA